MSIHQALLKYSTYVHTSVVLNKNNKIHKVGLWKQRTKFKILFYWGFLYGRDEVCRALYTSYHRHKQNSIFQDTRMCPWIQEIQIKLFLLRKVSGETSTATTWYLNPVAVKSNEMLHLERKKKTLTTIDDLVLVRIFIRHQCVLQSFVTLNPPTINFFI